MSIAQNDNVSPVAFTDETTTFTTIPYPILTTTTANSEIEVDGYADNEGQPETPRKDKENGKHRKHKHRDKTNKDGQSPATKEKHHHHHHPHLHHHRDETTDEEQNGKHHHHHHHHHHNESAEDGQNDKHHHHHHLDSLVHHHHHHNEAAQDGQNDEHHHHHLDGLIHHHHKHSKAEEPNFTSSIVEVVEQNMAPVEIANGLPSGNSYLVESVPIKPIEPTEPIEPIEPIEPPKETPIQPPIEKPIETPIESTIPQIEPIPPTESIPTDSIPPIEPKPSTGQSIRDSKVLATAIPTTPPINYTGINVVTGTLPSSNSTNLSKSNATADSEPRIEENSDKPENQTEVNQPQIANSSRPQWRTSILLEPPMPLEHKKDRLRHHIKLSHKKNTLGETIYKGHPSWLLMRNIQAGIFTNIRNLATGVVEHPDLFYTPPVTVVPTAPGSPLTFKFKDYCPMAFFKLREHFGINHMDYVTSLCQNWNEVSTPGKSGSLFFFSLDNQYVLKTIPKREAKLLRSLLPAYYEYMTTHGDSLLIRFMGLHRVKPHKGRQVRFLVMDNLFKTNFRIHMRFDLKGSTVGRELSPEARTKKNPTFKDLDFRRLNRKIHLGPNRDLFLKQLQEDCKFLSSQHIMDYSLLVGIHFMHNLSEESGSSDEEGEVENLSPPLNRSMGTLPPIIPDEEIPPPNQALSSFEREEGGVRARTPDGATLDEYYYIGVIDILMLYTVRKQMEHVAKRVMHPKGEISSVDPEDFAARFMHFITETVD